MYVSVIATFLQHLFSLEWVEFLQLDLQLGPAEKKLPRKLSNRRHPPSDGSLHRKLLHKLVFFVKQKVLDCCIKIRDLGSRRSLDLIFFGIFAFKSRKNLKKSHFSPFFRHFSLIFVNFRQKFSTFWLVVRVIVSIRVTLGFEYWVSNEQHFLSKFDFFSSKS